MKVDKVKFAELVDEGIRAIPEKFLRKLKNVDVVIEDYPSRRQLSRSEVRRGWTLFGLYEGVPQTQRGQGYNLVLPDKITIFQGPIEERAESEEEIREIVKETVWHEIAHHFGLGEEEVAKRAKRR